MIKRQQMTFLMSDVQLIQTHIYETHNDIKCYTEETQKKSNTNLKIALEANAGRN